MASAGPEPGGERTLEVWREAREWWAGAPYVEKRKLVDARGIRREEERTAPSLGLPSGSGQMPLDEDHSEEWDLKAAKVRDEKVAAANGALPQAYYERASQERNGVAKEPQPLIEGTAWSVAVRAEREKERPVEDVDRWGQPLRRRLGVPVPYAPLHMLSGYAFGRSVMLAEEAAAYAAQAGCPAAAIADPHSLIGAIEFAKACHRNGVRPLIGTSVELPEGGEIVLIAKSRRGYVSLSNLVTACHLGEPRKHPLASWERLERHSADLLCLTGGDVGPLDRLLLKGDLDGAIALVERLARLYGRESVFIEVERSFLPWQRTIGRRLLELAEATGITPVAGGVLTHGRRSHYPAQDVALCAESLCLVEEVLGRKLRRHPDQPQAVPYPERSLNAERFVRTGAEMAELYADAPELLANTLRVAERCDDDVLPRRARLPSLFADDNHALREIVESETHFAYGCGLTDRHRQRLAMEVERIQRLGYASHFLIAWEACRWARDQGIGFSGRGSVVDSAVAYVLGFSEIDAIEWDLHFDRFLPEDGTKRPDIDVDFEARRREDVRGHMVARYGVDRAAGMAAIPSYDTRGIVRAVGKAIGLPPEALSYLTKRIHGGVSANQLEAALAKRPELRGSSIPKERFGLVFQLAERLMDVPRGMGLHSAGVVISAEPLADTVPLMWSASKPSKESGVDEPFFRMAQWDKRSMKHVHDKYDVLCLRGQDVIGGVEDRLRSSNLDFSSKRVNATTDPEVFRAMRSGELIGIPQSASPAMRQAHQRLGTDSLRDASMVQAGIRPGVGGAVKLNELIARRRGKPYSFEHEDFERILGSTYGIIVYQEQVDQLLQTFCGFSGGQAEDLRDSIYKRRREDFAGTVRQQIVERAIARGYEPAVADRVYEMVSQFRGYAFSEGHALAFAEVSLRSVSLMQNQPADYFASLLSAQPAGYYGPCTLATEARTRGVRILGLDANRSRHRFEVEDVHDEASGLSVPRGGVRVGLMQLSGLSARTRDRILEAQDAAIGNIEERPHQPMISPSGGGVAVAIDEEGDLKDRSLWRSAGVRAFASMFDFVQKVEPSRDELEALILAGALDGLHPNRRAMLWAIKAAQEYAKASRPSGPNPSLPLDFGEPPIDLSVADFTPQEKAVHGRALLGMDVERHLMAFERERVAARGCVTTAEARRLSPGTKAQVVGNPIRLRFPPTPSGKRVVFFDLEDEHGILNCTVFDRVYQADGHTIVTGQYVVLTGEAQDRDGHTAFLVQAARPYRPVLLDGLSKLPIGTADFLVG